MLLESPSLPVGPVPGSTRAPRVESQGRHGLGEVLSGADALIVLCLALVALVRLALAPMAFQADTWLALVDGRAIVSSGIPHHALFTVMLHGRPFVDQQWLAQLITYGLDRLGGLGLLATVFVVAQTGSLACAAIAARRLGADTRAVIVVLALGWWLTLMPAQIRSEALVLPLFVALIYLLARDSREPTRRVYWCLPVLAVWANLHGSVVLAAGLVGLRGLSLCWERRHELRASRAWVRPAVLLVGSGACALATPYGLSTIGYYHHTLLNSSLSQWITEWQPITKISFLAVPFFILTALLVWSFGKYRHATTLWDRGAIVLLGFAAADAQRNSIWFGLLAIMLTPVAINEAVRSRTPQPSKRAINLTIAGVSVVAVLLFAVQKLAAVPREVQSRLPAAALATIDAAIKHDPSITIYADGNIADWLIWRQPSLGARLAYNDQLELLPARQFTAIESLIAVVGTDWKHAANGYRLLVLNYRESPDGVAAFAREPGARTLYRDQGYSVILRTRRNAA